MNTYKKCWNQSIDKIVQTNLSFDFEMDWLTKGLGLTGYAAYDYNIANNEVHHKPALLYKYNENTDNYDELYSSGAVNLGESNSVSRNDLYHIRLYYDNSFGDHNISVFTAYEQSEYEYTYLYGFRNKLFSTSKVELFAGEEDGRVVNGTSSVSGRVNYFGHFSYDFMRKYMIDFTLRHDGSYNFANGKRFGTFP